jgi:hypothetical protein
MDQVHERNGFNPIDVSTMTPSQKKKAMASLLFLTEKRDGRVRVEKGNIEIKYCPTIL